MSTFTNKEKSNQPTPDYELLIDDDYELLIDDTYELLIESATTGIVWTNESKS